MTSLIQKEASIQHQEYTNQSDRRAMLTKEDAKFIFEQAEKMLKDTVEMGNIIASRTTTIVTIISGSLIAFMGYLITKLRTSEMDGLFCIAIVATIYLFVLSYYAFENIKPAAYMTSGSLPETFVQGLMLMEETTDEKRITYFYINEFENYQFRIQINIAINRLRWKRYNNILRALLLLPLVMLTLYLLL